MKKIKFLILLLVALLCMSATTTYASSDVFDVPDVIGANDFSKVVQPSTAEYINASNDALMSQYRSKIILVTVPTTGTESIDSYANRLYKAWSVAYIGDGSSVMVVMATDDMQYWPIVGSHIQSALTPDIVNDILLKYMEPDFAKKDFDSAVRKTYDAFNRWYDSTYNGAYKSDAEQANQSDGKSKSDSKLPGIIWTVCKIVFWAFVIIMILFIYLRRKLRLKRLAKRKRMRRATIEKYRSEPKEQYSFSYSYINDDEWDS